MNGGSIGATCSISPTSNHPLEVTMGMVRPCLDCGALTTESRCPVHRALSSNLRYARRGTTRERGLSGVHAAMSKLFKDQDRSCECPCCPDVHDGTCGAYGTSQNPITAGHILARSLGGQATPGNYRPECRSCNSRRGAQRVTGESDGGGPGRDGKYR